MADPRLPVRPEALLRLIWGRLAAGADMPTHPFHTPCLASAGPAGPDARTVVLRRVDESARLIFCHTDLRSPKAAAIAGDPRIAWVFYDPLERIQLRVRGRASCHADDAVAEAAWAAAGSRTRSNYAAAAPPGSVVPPGAASAPLAAQESEAARTNFLVLACRVEHLDWLVLEEPVHRRVRFDWDGQGWRHAWIVP